jgi:hypothetical protein
MDGQQGGAPRFAELLDRAWTRHNLARVATAVLQFPAEANRWTAVVHATVETDRGAFSAVGDANPETVGPMLAARLVEAAETRAVGRALGLATNTAAAVAEGFAAADEPDAGGAVRREDHDAAAAGTVDVPAFLAAAHAAPDAAEADEPSAAPPVPAGRETGGRALTTARSLWTACTNQGIAAPEPGETWGEAQLREYVATWSAELRRARVRPVARP